MVASFPSNGKVLSGTWHTASDGKTLIRVKKKSMCPVLKKMLVSNHPSKSKAPHPEVKAQKVFTPKMLLIMPHCTGKNCTCTSMAGTAGECLGSL